MGFVLKAIYAVTLVVAIYMGFVLKAIYAVTLVAAI